MSTSTHTRTWETNTFRCMRTNGEIYYMENHADADMLRLYGYREPVVRVQLAEDPEGDYLGWQETGKPDELVMLAQDHLFHVQFTYGVQESIDRGRGLPVRVRIIELAEISL